MNKENEKLLNYTYENVKVGEWYLGYSSLCEDLGGRRAGGKTKEVQFTEWERHLNLRRSGNKIIVEEIYENPIPLENEDEEVKYYLKTGIMTSKGRDQRLLHFDAWSEDEIKERKNRARLIDVHFFYPKVAKMWDVNKNGYEMPQRLDIENYDLHWWNCLDCGYNFEIANRVFFSSNSSDNEVHCPYCKSSKYAKKIFNILTARNIEFKMEYFYSDLLGVGGKPLRFDFSIIGKDGSVKLIEYDGEYHDTNTEVMIHDARKNKYCKDNNIPLLRIHHTQVDFLEEILLDYLDVKKFEYIQEIKEVCNNYRNAVYESMIVESKKNKSKNKLTLAYMDIKIKLNKTRSANYAKRH